MKKLSLLFFLVTTTSFSCTCFDFFTPKHIGKFINNIDLIIVGTVVESYNPKNEKWIKYFWQENNSFDSVLIKIDKIFKGNIDTKYLIIKQSNQGNCSTLFKKNRQYIITGMITEKQLPKILSQYVTIPYENTIPETIDFRNIYINDKWKILYKKPNIVETSSCLSQPLNNKTYNVIMKNIN
ncbi:hypothetical protein [Flavicella sediminum]|uniref:hypothetical protein n=1 Tax=Flavicella sediminum TaxID=2585141 RepID=UPI00140E5679|nr:hypothetical protein [Flavicella sediminum]